MRTKLAFLVGGAVGYVLGTRAGREQFEKIRTSAREMWQDPRVQSTVEDVEHRASGLMKEKGPELKEKISGAMKSASDSVRSKADETKGNGEGTSSATSGTTGTSSTGGATPGGTPTTGGTTPNS